jgi:hypothetical protein
MISKKETPAALYAKTPGTFSYKKHCSPCLYPKRFRILMMMCQKQLIGSVIYVWILSPPVIVSGAN